MPVRVVGNEGAEKRLGQGGNQSKVTARDLYAAQRSTTDRIVEKRERGKDL